jgi:uncharacterized DUF497 family protein
MQVEFDPEKAAANLKKHGVPLDEAADSLLREKQQYAQGI